MNKQARLLAVPLALAAGLLVASTGASADSGRVSPQYQGYSSAGGQDPYANDTPNDVHVGGYGGQPVVTGYISLNLESLPAGSTIFGLRLTLVSNGSQSDNVNSSTATFEACLLKGSLDSNGYQSNPPGYNCDTHAVAEQQANGDWAIELAPLAAQWKGSNGGLALVAFAPPSGAPSGAPVAVAPSAWSVAFDHTKTFATVDYSPGSTSSASLLAAPASQPLAPLYTVAPAAVAPAAPLPPAVNPANPAAPAQAPVVARPAAPVVVERPRLDKQWLWLTGALGAAAVVMLLVGAGQYVLRTGHFRPGLALAASRSQLATPVAVLSLAAVFALGSTTQLVGVIQPGTGAQAGSGPGATSPTQGATGPGGAASGGTASGLPGQQVAGPGTAAGLAAGSAANSALNGPGVTSTAVRIGFTYTVNGQSANQAFGLKTPDTGNQQSEEQALVDYVNHHGGVAGRQIQPVYIAYDNARAESDPTINEELCHQFTEDYHVFAVVGGGGPPDDASANACYAQAGTLNFDLELAEPNLAFLRQTSPYIWLTSAAALDRMMQMEIAGLKHQGYFTPTPAYKLGVIVAGDPINEAVYSQVTLPALRAAGVTGAIDEFEVPHDTISDVANTMKQAAARFQLDQVTNVIFQGGGNYGIGSYATLFMLDAQSDGYTPRYGLNSDDGPVGLAGQIPESQLNHALAVGISGALDTDDQHYLPWPSTPNEKKCATLEAAAGNSFTSRLNAGVILFLCNAMFELQQAAQPLAGGPFNAQLWADQVMRLGNNVYNASMYRAYVGPGHWDAAGGYRLLHAVQNCSGQNACFVYDDSNIYG